MDQDRTIRQSFKVPYEYDVVFRRNIFDKSNSLVRDMLPFDASISIFVDSGLSEAQPELIVKIRNYFQGRENVHVTEVTGGEEVKNSFKHVDLVLDCINRHHIDRHSYVIAVGGGAVLDMVGFAAAIAHRGVRHIRIPTTVLSQNDSGVGVKNGINYFGKKNFTGTFAPPQAVINDITFLRTLEDRDWLSGISEAVKVSLLKDPEFFIWIENNVKAFADRDEDAMEELIFRCADLHVKHISGYGDPFETGSSRPLDFGHWSAHRLEHLTDYQLRHGEAVAIGISLDVCYAAEISLIPGSLRDRVLSLFKSLSLPVYHKYLGDENGMNDDIYSGLVEFQEHLGGVLTITLIEDIGLARDVHEVSRQDYDRAVAFLKLGK